MNNSEKMFVTDLDGTLFTDERVIHENDLAALESLGKNGVIRVFATGRSLYSFQKAIMKMGFLPTCNDMPVDYVIFSTGAGIMECQQGEILKKESLKSTDVSLISDYFDSLGLDYMIHKPVPDTRYFIYKIGSRSEKMGNCRTIANPDFYSRIALYRDSCKPMDKNESDDFGTATEILAIVPLVHGHEVADKVHGDLREFSVIKATSPLDKKSIWIEVFSPLVSKSQSVSWLCKRVGIMQKNVVSVGNDYNDLDLLKWSGRGFVVENAPNDVKYGFQAVASNNHCGVAEVICKLMDNG